jgi:acylphosphatase
MSAVVTGRVQGVGFRAWSRRRAEGEGLRGWVRNRADGAVEVHVAGPGEAVERFARALEEGPRGARVRQVRREDGAEGLPERGFEIRF